MYYQREIKNEGIPAGLYRHTYEIVRDMDIISKKIKETEEKLSVRGLIASIIDSEGDVIDEGVISTVDRLLCEAERSIFHLERLRDAMEYLEAELEEVRGLMKRDA